MLLSPAYLGSAFAEAEWIAAFARDPKGLEEKLVPVVVEPVEAPGLLSSVVQIRIFEKSEDGARKAVLDGIDRKRAKPSARPAFPGSGPHAAPKVFPGLAGPNDAEPEAEDAAEARPSFIPSLQTAPTDVDKRRFLRSGFATVQRLFERNAATTAEREPRIQIEIEMRTSSDLRGELFVDGTRRGGCRVWIEDGFSGTSILFAEGNSFANGAHNEMITIAEGGELAFSALMSIGFSTFERENDVKRMSPDDLAEFLWQRFVSPLSR